MGSSTWLPGAAVACLTQQLRLASPDKVASDSPCPSQKDVPRETLSQNQVVAVACLGLPAHALGWGSVEKGKEKLGGLTPKTKNPPNGNPPHSATVHHWSRQKPSKLMNGIKCR
jgi:hypothetical protein